MSKIVCDVCGTSYADSATQCPICGCVRPGDGVAIDMESYENESVRSEGYTYVKGGRFSRSNVKRRNQRISPESEKPARSPENPVEEKENKGDKGLIAAVCLLLLAIVAVVIYIVVHVFGSHASQAQKPNNPDVVQPGTSATTLPNEPDLSCKAIVLSNTEIILEVGQSSQLTVTLTPENTTDAVTFTSGDQAVATVSAEGFVQAVSAGETIISVTCGTISAECKVICQAPDASTESTQPTDPTQTTEPTVPGETTQPSVGYVAPYRLNRHVKDQPTERDATIIVGESFQLKLLDGNDKVVPVEWTVEKTSVCSVNGNTIKGKAAGTTTISTIYEGVTYTCLVRVKAAS